MELEKRIDQLEDELERFNREVKGKRKLSSIFLVALIISSFLALLPPPVGVVEEVRASPTSDNLFAHQEVVAIAEDNYYWLKNIAADNTGATLSVYMDQTRKLLGRFVYQFENIIKINTSTLKFYYHAYQDVDLEVHLDVNILVRQDNGSIRVILAEDVANTPPIAEFGTWATYAATYNIAQYDVVSQTDYLDIAIYAHVTIWGPYGYMYLMIDNNSLPIDNQTRIENWSFTKVGPPTQPQLQLPSDNAITNDNTPYFQWAKGTYADNHRLLVDNDNDFSSPIENILMGGGIENFTAQTAYPDAKYYWKVVAINAYGENSSMVWSFTIDTIPPAKPILVSPINNKVDNQLIQTFKWTWSAGATIFHIQIDDENSFVFPYVYDNSALADNSYDYTFTAGGAYYWRVRAKDAANNWGPWADNFKLNIYLPPPVEKFIVVADAYIDENFPTSNFGSADNLQVTKYGALGGKSWRTYLKFDLSGIPTGYLIENVRLWLHEHPIMVSDNFSIPIYIRSLENDNWLENTLTWSNASAPDVDIGYFAIPFWSNTNDWRSASHDNLLSFIENQINGDNIASIVLLTTALDNRAYIASKEYGENYAPYLEIIPKRPIQLSPGIAEVTDDNTPLFVWVPLENSVEQRLLTADNPLFVSPMENVLLGESDNIYQSTVEYSVGKYWWKVIAFVGGVEYSSVQEFSIARITVLGPTNVTEAGATLHAVVDYHFEDNVSVRFEIGLFYFTDFDESPPNTWVVKYFAYTDWENIGTTPYSKGFYQLDSNIVHGYKLTATFKGQYTITAEWMELEKHQYFSTGAPQLPRKGGWVQPHQIPGHPENLSSTTIRKLMWVIGSRGDNQVVQVDNSPDFASPEISVTLGKDVGIYENLDNLMAGGIYFWRVKAVNENGENVSPIGMFRLIYENMPFATTLSATNQTLTSVTLNASLAYGQASSVGAWFEYRNVMGGYNWKLSDHWVDVPPNPADLYGWGNRTPVIKLAAANSRDWAKQQADNICSGNENDWGVIQWALDNLPIGGGKVFLFDGTYFIAPPDIDSGIEIRKDNVTFAGESRDGTIIKNIKTVGSLKKIIGTSGSGVELVRNTLIENFTLISGGFEVGDESHGFWNHFTGQQNLVIRNLRIVNVPAIGIYFETAGSIVENVWVVNNLIENTGNGGIAVAYHHGGRFNRAYISNNTIIKGGMTNPMYLWPGYGIGFWNVENSMIVNNVIDRPGGCGILLLAGGFSMGPPYTTENILIRGNKILNAGFVTQFGPEWAQIEENKYSAISLDGMQGGISGRVKNITIRGNYIDDYIFENMQYGVKFVTLIENVLVENNNFIGVVEPVWVQYPNTPWGAFNIIIENNIGIWENTALLTKSSPVTTYSENLTSLSNSYYYEYRAVTRLVDTKQMGKILPDRIKFASMTYDGYIENSGTFYDNVWNAITGIVKDNENIIPVGQKKVGGQYTIYRAYLCFDTSSIPAKAKITSAIVALKGALDNSVIDFHIVLQNGQPTRPSIPLSSTDYNRTHYIGDGGQFWTGGYTLGAINDLFLNENALGWINKDNMTKFCLRSSRDIEGITPDGDEYVAFYAAEFGTSELYVSYFLDESPPPIPILLEPPHEAKVELNPTLRWTSVTDESPPVTYRLQVDNDVGFFSPEIDVDNLLDNFFVAENLQYFQVYKWRVRARDNVGNVSNWSSTYTFVTTPIPVLVSPENNTLSSNLVQTFKWTKPHINTTVYHLQIDNEPSFMSPFMFEKIDIADNVYTFTLATDGTFYWRVRAYTLEWWGGWPDNFKLTIIVSVPPKPTLVYPENNSTLNIASVAFRWDKTGDNHTYHFQLDNEQSFSSPYIYENDNLTDNTVTFNFTETGAYYWRVRSKNVAGWGPWADNFTINIIAVGTPPTKPILVSPENNFITKENVVTFTWLEAENADHYKLKIERPGATLVISPILGSSFTFSFADMPDNRYYWKVTAVNAYGENISETRVMVIDRLPPGIVNLKYPTRIWINDNTPMLTWYAAVDNLSGVDFYYIQLDDNLNFGSPENDFSTPNTYINVPYELSERTWYWRVRAIDKAGNVGEYNFNWFRIDITIPLAPALLEPVDGFSTTNRRPIFKWSVVTDYSGVTYRLQMDNDSNFSSPAVNVFELPENVYVPAWDLPNENYYWRVRAEDGARNIGSWSAVWTLEIYSEIPPENLQIVPPPEFLEKGEFLFMHPVADSFVSEINPDINFGVSHVLHVAGDTDGWGMPRMRTWTYLKYKVPENLKNNKYKIKQARLTMTVSSCTNTPVTLVHVVSPNWDEMKITWNNKPVLGENVSIFFVKEDENLSQFQIVYASLPENILDYQDQDGFISLALVPSEYNLVRRDIGFFSREAGTFGTIEITAISIIVLQKWAVSVGVLFALFLVLTYVGFKIRRINNLSTGGEALMAMLYGVAVLVIVYGVAMYLLAL